MTAIQLYQFLHPPGTACILLPHGDCAGRHIKSPCQCTYGCGILEELDNLCNFFRVKVKDLPHTACSDNDSGGH